MQQLEHDRRRRAGGRAPGRAVRPTRPRHCSRPPPAASRRCPASQPRPQPSSAPQARRRRRGVGMFGSKPVVDRHHRAVRAPGKLHALPVIGVEVAEYERSGMAEDHGRRGRRSAAVDADRDGRPSGGHDRRRRRRRPTCRAPRQSPGAGRSANPARRQGHPGQVGPKRRQVAKRRVESGGGLGARGRHVPAALCASTWMSGWAAGGSNV